MPRKFLEISQKILEVSTKFVEISGIFFEVSTNIIDISKFFVWILCFFSRFPKFYPAAIQWPVDTLSLLLHGGLCSEVCVGGFGEVVNPMHRLIKARKTNKRVKKSNS